MKKTNAIILVVLILFVTVIFFWSNVTGLFSGSSKDGAYDEFAQCLTQKGVKMYGASWCTHCQAQKATFGSSMKYVSYVECAVPAGQTGQAAVCDTEGVKSYPTWDFGNGKKLEGELSFFELSQMSGCPLPTTA